MLKVNIMSSRKAGNGSTIMPRIMSISSGAGQAARVHAAKEG